LTKKEKAARIGQILDALRAGTFRVKLRVVAVP